MFLVILPKSFKLYAFSSTSNLYFLMFSFTIFKLTVSFSSKITSQTHCNDFKYSKCYLFAPLSSIELSLTMTCKSATSLIAFNYFSNSLRIWGNSKNEMPLLLNSTLESLNYDLTQPNSCLSCSHSAFASFRLPSDVAKMCTFWFE